MKKLPKLIIFNNIKYHFYISRLSNSYGMDYYPLVPNTDCINGTRPLFHNGSWNDKNTKATLREAYQNLSQRII